MHNGGTAGNINDYTAIAHLQDCSVSPSRATRSISTKDSAGYAESLSGQLSWKVSASGLYAQDASYGYSALFTVFTGSGKVTLMIGDPTDGANLVHKGDANILDMPLTAPTEDNATFSVEFEGTGIIHYGAASSLF